MPEPTVVKGTSAPNVKTALGVANQAPRIRGAKIPNMVSNYKSVEVNAGGKNYRISREPTGYGRQQQKNGRFTIREKGNMSNAVTFRYGELYSGYTTPREAWKEVKEYLERLDR